MSKSLTEWLPDDHLVWTVLGAVGQMDLSRSTGRTGWLLPAVLRMTRRSWPELNRSSRGIERACQEDVAFKVITGMRTPDRSRIAGFRRRHETDIAELFDDVLELCREAGWCRLG